ncbi:hypothetical protein AALP_AA1G298700 [Arabis alpina]|uniref:DUF577 domain-containing protein n=1 Tax=Arabis alpina TaxID=50452 RepID=A0A087HRK4_ARAAL|nr:hypothetical protein AALP_AA1G298700 [Arabis alpina]
MVETSNLIMKAKQLVSTPSHEELVIVINQLFMNQETEQYQTSSVIYDSCVKHYPILLSQTLLKIYQTSSSRNLVRFRSIYLLYETFTGLRNRGFEFSNVALQEIKNLVVSCLRMSKAKESDAKILRSIVSFVAYNVAMLGQSWDELSDCILSVLDSDPLRAFNVFLGLPRVKIGFMNRFLEKLVEKGKLVLSNLELDREEDWILALETLVKVGILNSDLRRDILDIVLKSVNELMSKKSMLESLQRRLQELGKFLAQDSKLCSYNDEESRFVSKLDAEMVNRGLRFCPFLVQSEVNKYHEREWYKFLSSLSPLEILGMVNELEDLELELAIRRLNVLLTRHTSKKALIDISVIRKLQPLLVSCLGKQEISENTFQILGEVVHHVAKEIFDIQDDTWMELRDYITYHCQTEFTRGCYIFTCLTMALDDQHFVIPVMESLLPEIRTKLNPPRGLLVDNICWVLAFKGAFCAIIQMAEITSYTETVKEIEDLMIDSVKKLVVRRMEVGLVRRAFRDLERIVDEQMKWYSINEFALVTHLLHRLLAIQGMRTDSKTVLERINEMVDTVVAKHGFVEPT